MEIDFQDVKMLRVRHNYSGEIACEITQDEITPFVGYSVEVVPSDEEEERC